MTPATMQSRQQIFKITLSKPVTRQGGPILSFTYRQTYKDIQNDLYYGVVETKITISEENIYVSVATLCPSDQSWNGGCNSNFEFPGGAHTAPCWYFVF